VFSPLDKHNATIYSLKFAETKPQPIAYFLNHRYFSKLSPIHEI